jgi:hypothetical protein
MQLKRFHERRQDPLKQWKLSEVNLASLNKYDDYTQAEIEMFRFTHTAISPWIIIRANDQRRARLETIRHVLLRVDYEGRDLKAIGERDPLIIGSGPELCRKASLTIAVSVRSRSPHQQDGRTGDRRGSSNFASVCQSRSAETREDEARPQPCDESSQRARNPECRPRPLKNQPCHP